MLLVHALRYNLAANQVADRATVHPGDCRHTARKLESQIDRVSLGLLPSSEGSWEVAVRSLRSDKGGWLHIHGNVPVDEIDSRWVPWMANRLQSFVPFDDWVVNVTHVERVKSFAPKIVHCVADVHLRPRRDGEVVLQEDVTPPSCALSDNGVLHQAWMRKCR